MWIAAHCQIFTLDNLMISSYLLANWCHMCCCDGELMDHLLLHCPTHSLWVHILQVFEIQWVMPGLVKSLLFCWRHFLGIHNLYIWNLVLGCLIWIVWMEMESSLI